ncbi:Vegfa [Phodopus roborovskii]|uniref:Vascular permeability factor n=1 Tax=Phodopus roborovskii TaxID=109678 RepID=A0AAV0A4T7_PHORO|nr:Vegfa [Phodopus roborovskii]
MNFLLSWVHWTLALLLYLHHAKWSQAAPTTEGEQKAHEVVKFMDVYQRSYCRPIETLVDIFQEYPDEIEYIFKPSCVPLMRCGGCCNDEALECVPTSESNITMQIMRIKPHQSQHIGEMSFLQHSRCECRPKKDRTKPENHCEPCSERRKHLFVQDPQTCKCSCKNTDSRCKARQLELNERTCRLVSRGQVRRERKRDRESTLVRGQLLAQLLAACVATAAVSTPEAVWASGGLLFGLVGLL